MNIQTGDMYATCLPEVSCHKLLSNSIFLCKLIERIFFKTKAKFLANECDLA